MEIHLLMVSPSLVLRVFFEKQCFAVFCGCFAMFWTCFANVFCRHFMSERKMHSTVLRCIAQSAFCSFCAFCILCGLFCAVLWKTLKHAHKTPQNTAKHRKTLFLKNIHNPATWLPAGTWPPLRNLRVNCVLYAFATDLAYFGRKHRMRAIRNVAVLWAFCVLWHFRACCVRLAVFCDVISQNAFCDCFAVVFCGVLQMFRGKCLLN